MFKIQQSSAWKILRNLTNENLLEKRGRYYLATSATPIKKALPLIDLGEKYLNLVEYIERHPGALSSETFKHVSGMGAGSKSYAISRLLNAGWLIKTGKTEDGAYKLATGPKWSAVREVSPKAEVSPTVPEVARRFQSDQPTAEANTPDMVKDLYEAYCNDLKNFMEYIGETNRG